MEQDIYEITTRTCALVAKSENETEVIEENNTFTINKPITQILKESCEYYGSSLEGRIQGSKTLLGMCYKLPIIIESSSEIIFFPTMSPFNERCSWLSIKHIKEYKVLLSFCCSILNFLGNQVSWATLDFVINLHQIHTNDAKADHQHTADKQQQ